MKPEHKTKKQLIEELTGIEQQLANLQKPVQKSIHARDLMVTAALEWKEAIIESCRDAILICDENHQIIEVNSAASKLTGFSRRELLEMRMAGLLAENSKFTKGSGRNAIKEARLLRKDQKKIDVECFNRKFTVAGKDYTYTSVRDVSGFVASEARWQALIESAPDQIATIDREGLITFINHFEYGSADGIVGSSIFSCFAEKHHEAVRRGIAAVFKSGQTFSHELSSIDNEGNLVWNESRIAPLRHAGEVASAIIITRDITENKLAQEGLQRSEEELRQFLENAPDRTLIVNPEYKIIYINHQPGNNQDEQIVGAKWLSFFAEKEATKLKTALDQLFATGELQECEIVDGAKHYQNRLSPILQDGRVSSALIVATDITERIKVERSLVALAAGNASNDAAQFLRNCVRELASAYNADLVRIGKVADKNFSAIRTLAVWASDHFVENFDYDLAGTPCDDILKQKQRLIPCKAAELYPDDAFLAEHKIEGYYGAILHTSSNKVIGLVSVLSTSPMKLTPGTEPVLGIFADRISMELERSTAEKQMRRSEERFKALIKNVHVGVVLYDGEGRILGLNQSAVDRLGFTSKELRFGAAFLDSRRVVHEDGSAFRESELPLVLAIRQRKPVRNVVMGVQPAGKKQLIWLLVSAELKINDQGDVEQVFCSFSDITDRKLAEGALRQSEKRFRDLFDNAPDMYLILDPNGNIIDFNKKCLLRLGYSEQDLRGEMITRITHHGELPKVRNLLNYVRNTGKVLQPFEMRLVAANGQVVWVSAEYSNLCGEDGLLQEVRMVFRDIGLQKKLQDELGRAQRLEIAGRIAGQIAHDFNNLLAPLTAYPGLMRDELEENASVISMIDEMEVASQKIASINRQLLALGRRGHYAAEPIDLNEFIENAVALQPIPEGITVEKDLSEDLPKILAGQAQLTRMAKHLFSNAIDAMQSLGTLRLRTGVIQRKEPVLAGKPIEPTRYVKLTVNDDGCGIAKEYLDKIFDPFFTTKKMDKIRGSGLGLSVVYGIVEDHGGFIEVESKLGVGTSFHLFFPAYEHARPIVVKPHGEALIGGSEHILVVDDDYVQRKVTSQLLKRLGYHVNAVASGEEALLFLQTRDVDLVILDMVMEGIDGAETYRRILELKPRLKAIIVSGYAISKRVEQVRQMGAGEFIAKPLTLKTLATAVRKELDPKRATA